MFSKSLEMTVAHHLLVLLTFVSGRGQGGSLKSCDSLLKRVEDNDTKLVELVILPMKTFGGAELDRLSNAIGKIHIGECNHCML